jgi:ketosteroid isomerase-like protein
MEAPPSSYPRPLKLCSLRVSVYVLGIRLPGVTPGWPVGLQPQAEEVYMTQEAVPQVLAVQRDWLAAVRAKNIDAIVQSVTQDIVVIHPNGKTVRGVEELRADFQRFFGQFELEQSAVVEETVISGEWAFDISKISSTLWPVNGGDPKRLDSKVLTLLRQQGSEWRVGRVMSVLVS